MERVTVMRALGDVWCGCFGHDDPTEGDELKGDSDRNLRCRIPRVYNTRSPPDPRFLPRLAVLLCRSAMSALTASRPPLHPVIIPDAAPLQESLPRKQPFVAAPSTPPFIPSTVSPESSYSTLPSLTHSCASSSSSSSLHSVPERTNEHLAILLPKALWKVRHTPPYMATACNNLPSQPDSQASKCDNLYCRVKFSLFERKHVSGMGIAIASFAKPLLP